MEKPSLKNHISSETMYAIFIITSVSLFILANLAVGFIWPLYILAMALGFIISVKSPRSGLFAIVILTMIFERFFTLQTFFIGKMEYKIYPLDILMVGIIVGIFFQYLFGRIKIKLGKIDRILAGFIFLNIIYFLASVFFLGGDKTLAFSTLKNYGFYSLFYFMTLFLIRDENDLSRLLRFFLAGAIGIILFIPIGIVRGQGLWSEFTPLSTSGVRILAFTHGLYLSLALVPILIMQAARRKKFVGAWNGLVFVWLIGIVGTLMRHLWIALAAAFIAMYFFLSKDLRRSLQALVLKFSAFFLVLLLLVFYLAAMLPTSKLANFTDNVSGVVLERTGSLGSISNDESYAWRNLVWNGAYQQYKNNAIFGIGTGQKIYAETRDYKDFIEVRNIHNSWLAILIQLGILGILLFIYFIYEIVRSLISALRHDPKGLHGISILGMLVIFLVAFNFQPYLETNLLSIFFWMILGLSQVILRKNFSKQS